MREFVETCIAIGFGLSFLGVGLIAVAFGLDALNDVRREWRGRNR